MALVGALLCQGITLPAATDPVYENRGTVTMPSIDAITFLNRGLFQVAASDQPYDTQNTLNFTNFSGGRITGTGGVQFDLVGNNGIRSRAENFVNLGTILLEDPFFFFGAATFSSGGGLAGGTLSSAASWILVNAKNISNRGGMSVGSDGLIKLQGSVVNLGRSGLRAGVDPFAPILPGSVRGQSYNNELGISDVYWGVGQNNELDPAAAGPYGLGPITGRNPSSGPHEVLDRTTLTNLAVLPTRGFPAITNSFAVTNQVSPTNWVIQVVFVNTNTPDPGFKVDVKFGAPRIGNIQGTKMPMVKFSFEDIDTVTTEPYTNFVYVLDSHGALTNSVLFTNRVTRFDQRPSNFVLTQSTPLEWAGGTGTNAIYKPDLFYNPTYGSRDVTNWYSAYGARIGRDVGAGSGVTATSALGSIFGGIPEKNNPTNLPGRIEIQADRLDLSLSRLRSEGLLSVKAKELVGIPPYKLDSAYVSMDLGNPKGTLMVSNLVQPVVRRFNGVIEMWSGIWTNTTTMTADDPANPGTLITNTVEIRCHALIVQHDFITQLPVTTARFAAQAPSIVLEDDLTITESLMIDSPVFDNRSLIDFGTNALMSASFPRLTTLTNSGSIFTSEQITLGGKGYPSAVVVNSGGIMGSLLDLTFDSLVNSGSIQSFAGDLRLTVREAKLSRGAISSRVNLWISGDDWKAEGATITAGYQARNPLSGNTNYFHGSINIDVATRLADGGPGASNRWTVYDGIHLLRKPAQGDLLGTTVVSKAGKFEEIIHSWAGSDKGAVVSGYENNAAIGRLVLDGLTYSLFTFRSSTGAPAALYVDYLELTNSATAVEASLNIEDGFKLYFANSNIPLDQLEGVGGGRLVHVANYKGSLSGADITLGSGRTLRVNRALLGSSVIDSDQDGIPNALDISPFESAGLKVSVRTLSGAQPATEITWGSLPGNRYRVEYSDGVSVGGWHSLGVVESDGAGSSSYVDPRGGSAESRFYRVVQESP